MKTLKKNELKKINGGAQIFCWNFENKKTYCRWEEGAQICIGLYTWSGETIGLKCTSVQAII